MTSVRLGGLAAIVLLLLSGCVDQQQPAAPTTVIVNTPSDSGTTVLLTVVLVVAFLALIGAVVCAMGWMGERRRRVDSEDVLVALTGVPVSQARYAQVHRAPMVRAEGLRSAYEERRAIG